MLIDLIATFSLGLAVAGVLMFANRLLRGRLPKWTIPAFAGMAMLVFQIWSEYAWYERTRAALPAGVAVVGNVRESAWWRPWSYIAPQVVRFSAVNAAGARRNPAQPDTVLVDMLLFARNAPAVALPQLVDCANRRRALLVDGAKFDERGAIIDPDWVKLEPDDPLLPAVCRP